VSGPCLSSSVAGRPLRPATRHSLGGPLPRQLADRPRAHRETPGCPGFGLAVMPPQATCGINSPFGELSHSSRQIAHVLRTLTPLNAGNIATPSTPFDLHVLSTPPAFVLSQNQTLRKNGRFQNPARNARRAIHQSLHQWPLTGHRLNLTVHYLQQAPAFTSHPYRVCPIL
jgi:hypothetical protein